MWLNELGLHPERRQPSHRGTVWFPRMLPLLHSENPTVRTRNSNQSIDYLCNLGEAWRVGYVVTPLRVCALGVLWEHSFGHGAVISVGNKPTYCVIAMLPACDGECCETLKTGLWCFLFSGMTAGRENQVLVKGPYFRGGSSPPKSFCARSLGL
jgi:hypothetical protein